MLEGFPRPLHIAISYQDRRKGLGLVLTSVHQSDREQSSTRQPHKSGYKQEGVWSKFP